MIKQARQWKLLLCVSLFFLVFDGYFHRMQSVHIWLNRATLPFYQATDMPALVLRQINSFFISQTQLQNKVAQLQVQLLQTQANIQLLQTFKKENTNLRQLLKLQQKMPTAQVATVVNRLGYPSLRFFFVRTRTPVLSQSVALNAEGLLGLVVSQQGRLAKVMPLSNAQSHIAVKAQNGTALAIAAGNGHGQLVVRNVTNKAKIKMGQIWVSSGLDDTYPPGYVVGRIVAIQPSLNHQFVNLLLQPSAERKVSHYILLKVREIRHA